jgi:chitin disaccharide deacetylase
MAHKEGVLTTASLMVAGPAAADAIARARRLPGLRVGLHVVLVDGRPILPAADIPDLIGQDGHFAHHQTRAGFAYFFHPGVRRQLAREIEAQFLAFRATGLAFDHVNAHKHMHVHPTVAALMLQAARRHGVKAMRLPLEPASVLRRAEPQRRWGPGAMLLRPWLALLRRRIRQAGLTSADRVFGIAWSGAMSEARWLTLLARLPAGVSEIYTHPATDRSPAFARSMPDYRHVDELQALVSPRVRQAIERAGAELIGHGDLAPP